MEYAALDAACLLGLFDSLTAAAAPSRNAFPESCRPVTRLTGHSSLTGISPPPIAPAADSQLSSPPGQAADQAQSSHAHVASNELQRGSALATTYFTGRTPSPTQTAVPSRVSTEG